MIHLDDARRLTGPNLFCDLPAAILEVRITAHDKECNKERHKEYSAETIISHWQQQLTSLFTALNWGQPTTYSRIHDKGFSLVVNATIDQLYTAIDASAVALQQAAAQLSLEMANDDDDLLIYHNNDLQQLTDQLQAAARDELNTAMTTLQHAAAEYSKRFLWDDDDCSVGYGPHSQTWPADQLPAAHKLDWQQIDDIPVALVTGTNGKSTCVRLAAAILNATQLTTGITSTDYIRVGDDIIDTGDYSGPGGARMLLRDQRTEFALLEVARGGMLRRGLGVSEAGAAMVTNVAADHLGEYGINTVPELIEAKFIVARTLKPQQPLVINADDQGVIDYALKLQQQKQQRLVLFSEHLHNPHIQQHLHANGEAMVEIDGTIHWCQGENKTPLLSTADAPITMLGAARHNVQNALAAAALCKVLGIADQHIIDGLRNFASTPENNPGRGNLFEFNNIRALVDFAHNEHAFETLANTVKQVPAKRRLIMMGQAGDRPNEAIRDMVNAALSAEPDLLIACDIPGHERGREPGEIANLIRRFAVEGGMNKANIHTASGPLQGAQFALQWAKPGDFLLLQTLSQREEVLELVSAL